MIVEKFKIEDNNLIEELKKEVDKGVKNKNFQGSISVKSKNMTNYWYFIDDDGKDVFKKFSEKYLKKYSVAEAWGIKYEKGDEILKHNHKRSNNNKTIGYFDVSGVIHLNDSKTGTYFNDLDVMEKTEKGKVIIFNADTNHSVSKVEDMERYIISFNAYKKYKMNTYRS